MKRKKLNNRGVTMVELVISIALISVVMLFMYRLLADVEYDSDNEYFASRNQTQRIEILDYVQSFISSNNNVNIRVSGANIVIQPNSSTNNNGTMSVHIETGGKAIVVENSKTGEKRRWNLGHTGCYVSEQPVCTPDITAQSVESLAHEGFILYECSIEVYTYNSENKPGNNNTLDDITFSALTRQ